jgi:hypothetical protein
MVAVADLPWPFHHMTRQFYKAKVVRHWISPSAEGGGQENMVFTFYKTDIANNYRK